MSVADELEWTLRTVVSGGYFERIDPWPGRWVECRLDDLSARSHSGRSLTSALPKERVKFGRTALPPARLVALAIASSLWVAPCRLISRVHFAVAGLASGTRAKGKDDERESFFDGCLRLITPCERFPTNLRESR